MAGLTIDNEDLSRKLREIAESEGRSIEDLLGEFVEHYHESHQDDSPAEDSDTLVRQVRRKFYDRARRYWREVGDTERLALTNEQLDEQFWLFDQDDVPRLKSEMGQVEIPEGSLYRLGEALEQLNYRSGRSDTAERSTEILRTEFADYIRRRMNRPDPDAQ